MRKSKYSVLAIAAVLVASLAMVLPSIPMASGAGSFSMNANPTSQNVVAGGQTTYTISVTSNGFTGTVSLTATVPTAATGVTASLNPSSVSLTPGLIGVSTLTIQTGMLSPAGTYQITVTGKGPGAPSQSIIVSLTIFSGVLGGSTVNSAGSYLPLNIAELAASLLGVAGILVALSRRRDMRNSL